MNVQHLDRSSEWRALIGKTWIAPRGFGWNGKLREQDVWHHLFSFILKSTKAITWGVERPCLTARLSPTARNTPSPKKICIGGGSMSRWNLLLLLLLLLRFFSCCCPPSATSSTLPPPPGVLSVCWCRPCWTWKELSVVETDLMFCLWHDEW